MSGHQFALHLRGLPWSATKAEISGFYAQGINRHKRCLEFLEGRAQPDDCFICLNREGRPSGEAFVGFTNQDDYIISTKKHKQNMGSSYIEIYERFSSSYRKISMSDIFIFIALSKRCKI